MAVHLRHRQLVGEVGAAPQALDDGRRPDLPADVDEQPVARTASIRTFGHVAPATRSSRSTRSSTANVPRLAGLCSTATTTSSNSAAARVDDVDVTVGDRVVGAGAHAPPCRRHAREPSSAPGTGSERSLLLVVVQLALPLVALDDAPHVLDRARTAVQVLVARARRTPAPAAAAWRSSTSVRAGLRMVCSSSPMWWFSAVASSSTASSNFCVSVARHSSRASSASLPSACSCSPCSASSALDGVLAHERGVDLGLLGLAVGDQDGGQGAAGGLAVGRGVAQLAQQVLEEAVVVQDEVHDVAGGRAREVEVGHGAQHPLPRRRAGTRVRPPRPARRRRRTTSRSRRSGAPPSRESPSGHRGSGERADRSTTTSASGVEPRPGDERRAARAASASSARSYGGSSSTRSNRSAARWRPASDPLDRLRADADPGQPSASDAALRRMTAAAGRPAPRARPRRRRGWPPRARARRTRRTGRAPGRPAARRGARAGRTAPRGPGRWSAGCRCPAASGAGGRRRARR